MSLTLWFLWVSLSFTLCPEVFAKEKLKVFFKLDDSQKKILGTLTVDEKNRLLPFFYPRSRVILKYVDFKGEFIAYKVPNASINFYATRELKEPARLTFKGANGLHLHSGEKCIENRELEFKTNELKDFYECELLKCKTKKIKKSFNIVTQNYFNLSGNNIACPESFFAYWTQGNIDQNFSGWLIPVGSVDFKTKTAAIVSEFSSELYVSIADCLKDSKKCELVKLDSSIFETDYIRFSSPPADIEEIYRLKHWRKHLLPCVKKKDRECILKFITNKTPEDIDADMLKYYPDFGSSLTDENLKELEECIVKGQLLPHGFAYMGNKKVCILDKYFNSQMRIETDGENEIHISKIVTVDYPDAIERDPHRGAMSPANLHKDIFYREVK